MRTTYFLTDSSIKVAQSGVKRTDPVHRRRSQLSYEDSLNLANEVKYVTLRTVPNEYWYVLDI